MLPAIAALTTLHLKRRINVARDNTIWQGCCNITGKTANRHLRSKEWAHKRGLKVLLSSLKVDPQFPDDGPNRWLSLRTASSSHEAPLWTALFKDRIYKADRRTQRFVKTGFMNSAPAWNPVMCSLRSVSKTRHTVSALFFQVPGGSIERPIDSSSLLRDRLLTSQFIQGNKKHKTTPADERKWTR